MRRTAWRWLALAGLAAVFMVGITLFSAQEGRCAPGCPGGCWRWWSSICPAFSGCWPPPAGRSLHCASWPTSPSTPPSASASTPLPAGDWPRCRRWRWPWEWRWPLPLWTNGTSSRCPAGTAACGMWASTPSARWPGCSSAGRGRRCAVSEDSGLTAPGASPHGALRPPQRRRRRRCSRI